jgi:transcription elongation factor Elf1
MYLFYSYIMDDIEITACPFCGSQRVSCIEIDLDEWSVTCEGCKANGSSRPTFLQAADAWRAVAKKMLCKEEPVGLLRKMLQKVT